MDRRRFVPSSEGLEGRQLLAAFGANTSIVNPVVELPNTPAQKTQRIDRLPVYLRHIQPGRFLPNTVTQPLQADLRAIEGQLHSPPTQALDNFNQTLRDIIPHSTLSTDDAQKLSTAFGLALHASGATPQQEANLKADLNTIARIDSRDVNPVILATNDYAIILQTALGVGRPIRTPTAPTLASADKVGPSGTQITNLRMPHLVGTYEPGATMEILDSSGQVVGGGTVNKNGKYSAAFGVPLSDGLHTVTVRAVDTGQFSVASPTYTFKVIATSSHPRGPRG